MPSPLVAITVLHAAVLVIVSVALPAPPPAVARAARPASVRTEPRPSLVPAETGGRLPHAVPDAPGDDPAAVAAALVDPDPALRFRALESALALADPGFVPALRVAAASADRVERRLALGGLVRSGDPGAESALAAMAQDAARDGDTWGAVLAGEVLLRAGSPAGLRIWRNAVLRLGGEERDWAIERVAECAPQAVSALRGETGPALRLR